MGAALALSGLTGSRDSGAGELRSARQHAGVSHAFRPRCYAATALLNRYALPVPVETTDARPLEVEGNPDHRVSLSATEICSQVVVHDLYDPDRSSTTERIASCEGLRLGTARPARALPDSTRRLHEWREIP